MLRLLKSLWIDKRVAEPERGGSYGLYILYSLLETKLLVSFFFPENVYSTLCVHRDFRAIEVNALDFCISDQSTEKGQCNKTGIIIPLSGNSIPS